MADDVFVDVRHDYGPIGRVLDATARLFAIGAGVTLTTMAMLSLVSVVGRAAFSYPILGDYELVQLFSAVAVSMSLPFCQMVRGHVIVDFFTTRCSAKFNKFLDLCANLLLAIGAFTFAWRMILGTMDIIKTGDASMLLDLPTWYGYVPMVASFFLLGCTALYSAWEDFTGERK